MSTISPGQKTLRVLHGHGHMLGPMGTMLFAALREYGIEYGSTKGGTNSWWVDGVDGRLHLYGVPRPDARIEVRAAFSKRSPVLFEFRMPRGPAQIERWCRLGCGK